MVGLIEEMKSNVTFRGRNLHVTFENGIKRAKIFVPVYWKIELLKKLVKIHEKFWGTDIEVLIRKL